MPAELFPWLGQMKRTLNRVAGELQAPCPAAWLDALRERTRQKLHANLPEEYCQLLSEVDGINFNGLIVYASHDSLALGDPEVVIPGFVEWNLNRFRKDFQGFENTLVFAEDALAYYALDLKMGRYRVSNWGSTTLRWYATFHELIADAVRHALPDTSA